jgi:hypothetical protein
MMRLYISSAIHDISIFRIKPKTGYPRKFSCIEGRLIVLLFQQNQNVFKHLSFRFVKIIDDHHVHNIILLRVRGYQTVTDIGQKLKKDLFLTKIKRHL